MNTQIKLQNKLNAKAPTDQLLSFIHHRDTTAIQLGEEQFAKMARQAAHNFNCRFLFEFPAILINQRAGKAAAILCPANGEFEIVFLLFSDQKQKVDVLSAAEVPGQLVDFAWSFTQILAVIPVDKKQSVQ